MLTTLSTTDHWWMAREAASQGQQHDLDPRRPSGYRQRAAKGNKMRRPRAMGVIIADEILQATRMTPEELRHEIAVLLFQKDKLTLGQASRLAGMSRLQFQRLLASRQIPVHYESQSLKKISRAWARRTDRDCCQQRLIHHEPGHHRTDESPGATLRRDLRPRRGLPRTHRHRLRATRLHDPAGAFTGRSAIRGQPGIDGVAQMKT